MSGAELMAHRSCPRCAEPAGPGDRYCEHCGARLPRPKRDRVELDVGVAAGVSDRGRRHYRNEDALALRDVGLRAGPGSARRGVAVAIVCDGVSSSARPDAASETAAEVAAETLAAALRAESAPLDATRQAIRAADRAVSRLADSSGVDSQWVDDLAPACTLVSAIVTSDAVTVGWVGDSRAYWIPQEHTDSTPTRLTEDDSWLAHALAEGSLSPAQAVADRRAHAITAWLGEDAEQVDPHIVTLEPEGPGVVVICTDGLWNYLDSVEELSAALPPDAFDAPLDAARHLVEIALRRGGRDNITVAVLPFTSPRPVSRYGDISGQNDPR